MFAVLWCVFIPASAVLVLIKSGWHPDMDVVAAVSPYVPGSLIGGYLGGLLAFMISEKRASTVKFAAFFLSVASGTLLATAFIYSLHFRIYFSEFHQPFGTFVWILQTVFTSLGSMYLFAASGVRILFPFGVIALVIASIGFSRGWMTSGD